MSVDELKSFTWYGVYSKDGFFLDNMLIINEVNREKNDAVYQGFLLMPGADLQFRRGGWLFSLPIESDMEYRLEKPKDETANRKCIVELFHLQSWEKETKLL
jgi:hypothetical protein